MRNPLIILSISFIFALMPAVGCVAATINVAAGGDLAGAVQSANAGDTVEVGAGTFVLNAPVTIPSGVTLLGYSTTATHVVFNLNGGANASYAFILPANASKITIAELDLVSNHGAISMTAGTGYQNVVISHNNIQYGGGQFANGTLVFGISGTVKNDGLKIIHNYFHDSPGTARNWCIWFASNANLDFNLFYNVNDGGQLDQPGLNVSFSFNYGTQMHRMGQEVYIGSDANFVCTGNVFYDYVSPYYDTEGVSIVGGTGAVDITNNYFSANVAAGSTWGQADEGGRRRFGYGIECTGGPSNVSGNTLVGTWAEVVSSDEEGAVVANNDVFGSGLWGNFEGEPGQHGFGSVVVSHNSIDAKVSDAPTPPDNLHAGPHKHSNKAN